MIFEASKLSLKIALLSTLITIILSFILALFISKGNRKRDKLIEGFISFPLFFPPSVLGYILLILLGKNGILGRFLAIYGIEVIFTWKAGVIACVLVSLPMAYQCIKAGFLEIDREHIEAAFEMGATKLEMCRYIFLPLIRKNIGAGAVLSFGRSFGEFGATLMIAGNIPGKTQTIPMAIYYAVERGDNHSANILLIIVTCISFAVMWCYNHYWLNNSSKQRDHS
ncbi:molybdate ABC transporter permease subunit [Fusobacteria bacterium ZRK30]|nr:molybdate ABC transporter permease subunit [Fusobacteria bacterium ZRK30]